MKPNPKVAATALALRPLLRAPVARVVAYRYRVGPRTARVLTGVGFEALRLLQFARRVRSRAFRALTRPLWVIRRRG